MALTVLTTTDAIFDVLGGNKGVQGLTGDKPSTVSNWRTQKHFPARHIDLFREALGPLGCSPAPSLFGMTKSRVRPKSALARQAAE